MSAISLRTGAEGMAYAAEHGGDCDTDAHTLQELIPEGTLVRYICPVSCGDCSPEAGASSVSPGRAGALTLGGHTELTEWGLHFDGVEDFATLQTSDYGQDTSWTYSLWFSKAECNPNAATNWEYMIAHSASENSNAKLGGRGTADSDDNVHIYLGCRPGDLGPNSFWRFKSYADPDTVGAPSNFIRFILMDSAGGWTLTDLPLSATLEEYTMGGWNHLAFSMSAVGWQATLDGEVISDAVYGVFGHHNYLTDPTNLGNPTPSAATMPCSSDPGERCNAEWAPFLGFGDRPLYLGSRIIPLGESGDRNEWLGYLSNFAVYSDTMEGACATALYQSMVELMPLGVPQARIEGTCSDWLDLPMSTESTLTSSSANPPTLGGDARLTRWGLHFDGENDWSTLPTPDYGADASWTYSLWFSKSECNPSAAWNWEYMIAHSAAEHSAINLEGKGTPDGDDNCHIYLGCRPGALADGWRFRNYTSGAESDGGNMLRTILMDSAGHFTLTDLALSQTLEEVVSGSWNHFTFSMSPRGFVYTMDGEVLPDSVFGIFMHHNFCRSPSAAFVRFSCPHRCVCARVVS